MDASTARAGRVGHSLPGMTVGFQCSGCGEWHPELPFSYHSQAPAPWVSELAEEEMSELGEEQCVIRNEHFFVRGLIRIPIVDADQDFEWGVWTSLSRENFVRMSDLWHKPGRETEPPYFGWLSTALPIYEPPTLLLKTAVHTRPVGLRPLVELKPSDHPLATEQRTGITLARVRDLAERLLHGES